MNDFGTQTRTNEDADDATRVVERVVYVEKPKRHLFRKLVLYPIVGLFALGVVVAAIPGGDDSNNSREAGAQNTPNTAQVSNTDSTDNSKPAPKPRALAVGETGKVKGGSYTVTEAYPTNALHDTYKIDPPKRGNFVVVDFTYTNESREAQTLDYELLTLHSAGATYEPMTDTFSYVPTRLDPWLTDVNPGVSHNFRAIYVVAPDSSNYEFHAMSADFWSTQTAKTDLGF